MLHLFLQYERFTDPVIRGFHTEMETVYEEYNMSLTRDARKVNDTICHLTLSDVKAFQEKYIKGKMYAYCILGDTKDLDMNLLSSFGKVKELTLEDIFGY